MNDKYQNIEIDELIRLMIDGQATERQQTELKRLMQHDPSIAERIHDLRKQQRLLNALPVETAPVSLADDVRAAMERKLILAESTEQSQNVLATGHLYARRLMAIAAMFLLPIGLLALVVFQIVRPATEQPPEYFANPGGSVDTSRVRLLPDDPTPAVDALPFKGTLVLQTDDLMAVSGAVREAIEKQNLLTNAFPDRTVDVSRFEITASPRQVADLVDALSGIRPQCSQVTLHVNGDASDETIEIVNIENEQLKILVYEDNRAMFDRLAARYAAANRRTDPLFEATNPGGYPDLPIPTLTGNYDTAERSVLLTIQVERSED